MNPDLAPDPEPTATQQHNEMVRQIAIAEGDAMQRANLLGETITQIGSPVRKHEAHPVVARLFRVEQIKTTLARRATTATRTNAAPVSTSPPV